MAQNDDTYDEYMRKCQPLADKKYMKLEAISGNDLFNPNKPRGGGGGGAKDGSAIEEATKAKASLRRDVDNNINFCEKLYGMLTDVTRRVDDIEATQKKMKHTQTTMDEQIAANQKLNADALEELANDCKNQFSSAAIARQRLDEQQLAKIKATENAITLARKEEFAATAKERDTMRSDAEAIKASIAQLKADIIAADERRDAKFNGFASKNAYELGLVRDAIPEQVGELGRYVDRTKGNIEQQIRDMQAFVDSTAAEFDRRTKEESRKLNEGQANLLETVRNNDAKQSRDLEAKANLLLDRFAADRGKLESCLRDERKLTELGIEERKKSADDLANALRQEVDARRQDTHAILERVGRECMQREKDELSIITAIESILKEMNEMNSSHK